MDDIPNDVAGGRDRQQAMEGRKFVAGLAASRPKILCNAEKCRGEWILCASAKTLAPGAEAVACEYDVESRIIKQRGRTCAWR